MAHSLILDRYILERATLLIALTGIDEAVLTQTPVCGTWTALDVLAHMAGWEAVHLARYLPDFLADRGDGPRIADADSYNAAQVAARKGWTLAALLAELATAEETIACIVDGLSEDDLRAPHPFGERTVTVEEWVAMEAGNNAEHARELTSWWKGMGLPSGAPGPKVLLQEALRTSRRAFDRLALALPEAERIVAPVCGVWTVSDLVGHLADWEGYLTGAAAAAAHTGELPQEPDWARGIEDWNTAHAAQRQGYSWAHNWADHVAAGVATDASLGALDDAGLARRCAHPYAATPYAWLAINAEHTRDHARGLSEWLGK